MTIWRRWAKGSARRKGRELARMSWLEFALEPVARSVRRAAGGVSVKVKDALLKRRFTDRQIGVAYDYLTRTDHDVMGGMLGLATYGGRINTVAPDATASAQRDSILDIACNDGLAGSAGRGEESGLGAGVLSGSVRGDRGRAGSGRGVRWGIHQSSRHRPRGPGAEYVGRALAHAVLPGELSAPAADQGAMGPAERVPARVVHSGRDDAP